MTSPDDANSAPLLHLKPHQKLAIEPVTDLNHPAVLQPGEILEVTARVHNTTPNPDRFWLTCAGLPIDWVSLRYGQEQTASEAVRPDGLTLPSGETGQIILSIHPPSNAPPIPYTATLQLHSKQMLEPRSTWLYLKILPVHALQLDLRAVSSTIRQMAGEYEICLLNQGNTDRHISLGVREAGRQLTCEYLMTPARVWVLPPNGSGNTQLWVKPKQRWKRPLLGQRSIDFWVEVEDAHHLPLPSDRLPGTLIWQGRPLWQVALGLLAGVGGAGAIVLMATGLFGIANRPQILEFATENSTYQESDPSGAPVQLNWQVRNPAKLRSVQLTSRGQGGRKFTTYDFSQGIPKELQPFCTLQQTLKCQAVPTAARDAGAYKFELALTARTDSAIDRRQIEVSIQPQPPTIAAFKINDKEAPAKLTLPLTGAAPLNFSWQVNGRNLNVELLPAPGKVQAQGKLSYALQQPGVKQFTLRATNAAGQQVSRSVTIEATAPPTAPPTASTVASPASTAMPSSPSVLGLDTPREAPPRTSPAREALPSTTRATPPPASPRPAPTPLTVPPSELPPQFN